MRLKNLTSDIYEKSDVKFFLTDTNTLRQDFEIQIIWIYTKGKAISVVILSYFSSFKGENRYHEQLSVTTVPSQ